MASHSVTDTVGRMKCDELGNLLRQILSDSKYQPDLQKLIDGNINGALFLELPDDPELLNDLKLSPGGKAHIRRIVRSIKDRTFEFPQADTRKLVEPDRPWCSTLTPNDNANGSGNGSTVPDGGSGMHKAWIPADAVWPWKDYEEILVEFKHVDLLADWTIGDGQPMNTHTILLYANKWSEMGKGKIPRFVEVKQGNKGQIRVSFNNDRVCNSQLGMRAQNVKASEPTMNLDLHNGCPNDEYKKYVIIHEFGHALGLGHEHQRSKFWMCIKAFMNIETMKKDLKVTDDQFAIDWSEIDSPELGPHTVEYDPDSIMHYWFKVEWLTNGYFDKDKVERDHKNGILSDMAAKALLGVHKRHKVLADKPSAQDIQLLKQVYGGTPNSGGPTKPGSRRVRLDSGAITTETENSDMVVAQNKRHKPNAAEDQSELISEDENVDQGRLRINDLKDVKTALWPVRTNWPEIGENLGLDKETLDSISINKRDDPGACLREVISTWLKRASTPERPVTWAGLVAAWSKKH